MLKYALLAILIVTPVSCALSRDGTLPASCTSDAECPVPNPCNVALCTPEGLCSFRPDDDNSGLLEQTDGDCQAARCSVGAIEQVPDDDPPIGEACVRTFSCRDGVAVEEMVADGTPCELGSSFGLCLDGACVVRCEIDSDCKDGEACTIDTCGSDNLCDNEPLDNVTSPDERPGDCNDSICTLGEEVMVANDSQLPDDGQPCTDDLCNQGVPEHPPLAIGSPCSGVGREQLCNALGDCVECNGSPDCAPLEPIDTPDCESLACSPEGVCSRDFQPAGTPLNATLQVAGDCKARVCDGMGDEDVNPATDISDLPLDALECTDDVCTGPVPSNPFKPIDTPCGTSLVCNAVGQCIGCNSDNNCDVDTDCTDWSCNLGTSACEPAFAAAGTPTSNQTAQDCQQEVCDGAGVPVQVNDNGDPIIDLNPCTRDECVGGTPQNPPEPIDTACMGSMFCNAIGSCVQCNNNGQCNGGDDICESDNCVLESCMVQPHSAMTPAPAGFQTSMDCQIVLCDGLGDVNPLPALDPGDFADDMIECTADACNGTMTEHTPRMVGTPCSGGFCDGASSCVECIDNGDCAANESCHLATYTCRLNNGQACLLDNECFSAMCRDGFCCDGDCNGTCEACDLGGAIGTCAPVPAGQDPDGECAGDCSGARACQGVVGDACMVDGDCINNQCRDGYCCDADCGNCQACDFSGSEGACMLHATGTDPDMDCATAGHSCNAVGVCACGLDPAPASGQSCPAECTGGCMAGNTVCVIDCSAASCGAASQITCPPGRDCIVNCIAGDACKQHTINCPDDYSCDITCGNFNNACDQAVVNCTTEGTCALSCDVSGNVCNQLTMNCGDDQCSATCTAPTNGAVMFNMNNSCAATISGC